MTVSAVTSLRPAELKDAATRLLASGGRMQMAYAWYPEPHRLELRYAASPRRRAPFAIWRCDANEPVPSLAAIAPLLSWYEREITDLFGLAFTDHPQPHRLVLHDGVQSSTPPFAPDYPPDRPLRVERNERSIPEIAGAEADVQLLPFGPVRADVVESAEFLFFYVGEAILHYHPRLFFKHRGMEKRFEGLAPERGVVLAERVSGVGSVAHALAYCQAVEAAANCIVPARAQVLARAAGGDGAALQSSALFRPSLPHHDAQGRRGGRQAAGGASQAAQYPADRQPLPAQRACRSAGCGAICRRKAGSAPNLRPCAKDFRATPGTWKIPPAISTV